MWTRKTHAELAMREASLASRRACTMPQLSEPITVQTLCDYKNRVDAYTGVLYCNFSCQIHSMISYSHKCQAIYYWTPATLLQPVPASQCPYTHSLDLLGHTLTPHDVGTIGHFRLVNNYNLVIRFKRAMLRLGTGSRTKAELG